MTMRIAFELSQHRCYEVEFDCTLLMNLKRGICVSDPAEGRMLVHVDLR